MMITYAHKWTVLGREYCNLHKNIPSAYHEVSAAGMIHEIPFIFTHIMPEKRCQEVRTWTTVLCCLCVCELVLIVI